MRDACQPGSGGFHIGRAVRSLRTKSDLVRLFRTLGLRPTKRLGQNFLVDPNLLDYMVRAGEVGPGDVAVDIGAGTGLLTTRLADAAGKVVAIEKDRRLHAVCSRVLEGRSNVVLLLGDVLASKHALAPSFLDAVRGAWEGGEFAALRVVSSLPYSTASLIVPNLLESSLPLATMVVTLQKEVAQRMTAAPGTGAYGALSVLVQAQARVAGLRDVPPEVFWPRPKVRSALVRLEPEPERQCALMDRATFAAAVRAAFGHRRKTALNSLVASRAFGVPHAARPRLKAALAACGIEATARAEEVPVDTYIRLANRLAGRQDGAAEP